MSRIRAASIHLVICVAFGSMLLAFFWLVIYPAPLFRAAGGREIFLTLLGVDIALGPLLTLIVFEAGKKSLKFDLVVIAAVQTTAMAYGVLTLYAGRPVYLASLGHRFDLVQASELDEEQLSFTEGSLPRWGPVWTGIKPATDSKERERMALSGLAGADYGHYPQYHAPLETMRDEILKNAKPIAELRKLNAEHDAEVTAWLRTRGQSDDSVVFQGLKARAEDMAVIMDAKTAKVIGIAPFKPWD